MRREDKGEAAAGAFGGQGADFRAASAAQVAAGRGPAVAGAERGQAVCDA